MDLLAGIKTTYGTILALPILSLLIWWWASYKYGQAFALAYTHSIANQNDIVIDPSKVELRSTLDALAERRMSILANIVQGAAFIGTAGALFMSNQSNPFSYVLEILTGTILLVISWGACNDAGISHTFYKLSLNAKGYGRNGKRLGSACSSKKADLFDKSVDRDRKGKFLDFLPTNSLSTAIMLLAGTIVLCGWWGYWILGQQWWGVIAPPLLFSIICLISWRCGLSYEASLRK